MNEFVSRNPTGRFSGLAETYDRYRPDYPAALWQFLRTHCSLPQSPRVVDIGCGTGIASRQMASLGWIVVGVEPNADMREQAISRLDPPSPRLRFCAGAGEQTGLPAQSADLVTAAQAFHWFRAEEALAEIYRILKPGGWIALFWNERDDRDQFTAAFGAALNSVSPEKAVAESRQASTGEVLLTHPLYEESLRTDFPNEQVLDRDGLMGRAFSVSFGPRDPDGRERFSRIAEDLFENFARDGRVALRYRTLLYVARARRVVVHFDARTPA